MWGHFTPSPLPWSMYATMYVIWILPGRKVYTAVTFKNYFISHVAKNKIMTDGKHKLMDLEWTAPDGQNVTGN